MSAEDLEKYETEMELSLNREYKDIVGQFSYVVETERRFYLANSVELVPRNTDGEVEEFMLLPIRKVAAIVRDTDEFKLNCNLVIIDFLIRHGLLEPHSDEYLDLVLGLRQPLKGPEHVPDVIA